MGIIGKIEAHHYSDHVGGMTVGQTAYINAGSLIITRNVLFLDRMCKIILEEDFYNDVNVEFISVKRLGEGFTQNDFEIDLTILPDIEYYVEDDSVYFGAQRQLDRYILFDKFEMEILRITNSLDDIEIEHATIESLTAQLQTAEEDEQYEEAVRIREMIEELKKQKSE